MDCMALSKWIRWLYFYGLGGSATMEYSSLHLPKELEEKVKDAAESEARNVTSYITSLILKDLKEKELLK